MHESTSKKPAKVSQKQTPDIITADVTLPQLKVVFCGEIKRDAPRYTSPDMVVKSMADEFRTLDREVFYVLHLNGKNQIIAKELISVGSLSQAIVHPREVFKGAVLNGSKAIICVHNHPAGDPSPSTEDDSMTQRLQSAGNIMGIDLLDHIIIGVSDRGTEYFCYSGDSGTLGRISTNDSKPPVTSKASTGGGGKWGFLKTLRKEAGLTQQKLADQVGVTQAYISNVEKGIIDPTKRQARIFSVIQSAIKARTGQSTILQQATA